MAYPDITADILGAGQAGGRSDKSLDYSLIEPIDFCGSREQLALSEASHAIDKKYKAKLHGLALYDGVGEKLRADRSYFANQLTPKPVNVAVFEEES